MKYYLRNLLVQVITMEMVIMIWMNMALSLHYGDDYDLNDVVGSLSCFPLLVYVFYPFAYFFSTVFIYVPGINPPLPSSCAPLLISKDGVFPGYSCRRLDQQPSSLASIISDQATRSLVIASKKVAKC